MKNHIYIGLIAITSLSAGETARKSAEAQLQAAKELYYSAWNQQSYGRGNFLEQRYKILQSAYNAFDRLVNSHQIAADLQARAQYEQALLVNHQAAHDKWYVDGRDVYASDLFGKVAENPAATPEMRYTSLFQIARLRKNPQIYQQIIEAADAPIRLKRDTFSNFMMVESEIYGKNYGSTESEEAFERIDNAIKKLITLPLSAEEKAEELESAVAQIGLNFKSMVQSRQGRYFSCHLIPFEVLQYRINLLNLALNEKLPEVQANSIQAYKADLERILHNKEDPASSLKRLADGMD